MNMFSCSPQVGLIVGVIHDGSGQFIPFQKKRSVGLYPLLAVRHNYVTFRGKRVTARVIVVLVRGILLDDQQCTHVYHNSA